MGQLTIEGKLFVFKTLAVSIVVHLILVKDVPSTTISQLEYLQKQFFFGKTINSCNIIQYITVIFLKNKP